MNERSIVQTIEFKGNGEDFSATSEAEAWAKEHGFYVAPMCGGLPRGIARDVDWIAKWRNLTEQDKTRLEGIVTAGNHRNGAVSIELYVQL